jgi:hypothetical protein
MQLTKTYNGTPIHNQATLGDLQTFERLSDDVQRSLIRLFGAEPLGGAYDRNGILYTENQMVEAYMAGFDDCAEQMARDEPYVNEKNVRDWVKDLK